MRAPRTISPGRTTRSGTSKSSRAILAEALRAYEASLAIRGRIAKADPSNADWQRVLAVSHDSVGDVRKAEEDRSAALQSYQAARDIFERLAKADPGNMQWQRDVSVSDERPRSCCACRRQAGRGTCPLSEQPGARGVCSPAIRRTSGSCASPLVMLVDALLAANKPDEAADAYRENSRHSEASCLGRPEQRRVAGKSFRGEHQAWRCAPRPRQIGGRRGGLSRWSGRRRAAGRQRSREHRMAADLAASHMKLAAAYRRRRHRRGPCRARRGARHQCQARPAIARQCGLAERSRLGRKSPDRARRLDLHKRNYGAVTMPTPRSSAPMRCRRH